MIYLQDSLLVLIALYAVMLNSSVSSTFAFSPSIPTRTSIQISHPLNLHPDQAPELVEAAASEFLKSQHQKDEEDTINEETKATMELMDDTSKSDSHKLSASSCYSSSSNQKKWWSKTFSSFIRRHD